MEGMGQAVENQLIEHHLVIGRRMPRESIAGIVSAPVKRPRKYSIWQLPTKDQSIEPAGQGTASTLVGKRPKILKLLMRREESRGKLEARVQKQPLQYEQDYFIA